jgi:hypothetical protein
MSAFEKAELGQVAAECRRVADELREMVPSRWRVATADLLEEASNRLAHDGSPGSAESLTPRIGLVAAFTEVHAREAKNLRHRAINRAADLVLGEGARQWLLDGAIRIGERPYDLALASDEGLRAQLERLAEMQAHQASLAPG